MENNNKKSNFGPALKEWFRKKIVNLKRKPQTIVLVMLIVAAAYWLITLFQYSKAINSVATSAKMVGFVVFINTLMSLLVVALFNNAFPKRKNPNIVFIVLLFVFMAIIIACDILYVNYYMECINSGKLNIDSLEPAVRSTIEGSFTLSYVHSVLVGICAVLLATLPLYAKAIRKINTRKEVESNEVHGEIDLQDTD